MAKYKYTPKTKEELKALVNNLDIYLGDIDTQYITDMSDLFFSSKRENFSGIEFWNTSNVANMDGMFAYTNNFNQPIGGWNVSRVKNMAGMFWGAINFNQPLDMWDVSNVTDMSWMFCHAVKFNQSLGLWDTSNVKNMSYMFVDAYSFNQDIGNWNLSSVECMTNMFKDAKNFQFEQPVKYSFYNLDKNRSNTMQNGKIVNITDKMITLELKYNFYNSKKCSKFIDYKTGYLCLYNFETGQIFSVPATLKTVGENENDTMQLNFNSNTSVYINISTDKLSNIDTDLLSNPEVFGFCLMENTKSIIISELKHLLTIQFQSAYIKKTRQSSGMKSFYSGIIIMSTFAFTLIYTGSLDIALIYSFYALALILMFFISDFLFIKMSVAFNTGSEDDVSVIIKTWVKYREVPFSKRLYVNKKMIQLLKKIRQLSKQQEELENEAKENTSMLQKSKKAQQKHYASSDNIIISLDKLTNLLLISDNELRNICSNTYKLCEMVNSIQELSTKTHLKRYIENKLKKIEDVLKIWKTANNISKISQAEADNIKQKSIDTINLINKKLKEKIQNEILLININLSSELEALKIVENLR